MSEAVTQFRGQYEFLSNFSSHPAGVYPTAEHAFQALKTNDANQRDWVRTASSPREAKQRGRALTLVSNWESVKDRVMADVLLAKFAFNDELARALVATAPAQLIEGNTWHDQYWGDCSCPTHRDTPGKNKLGLLLMELRTRLEAMLS